LNADSNALADGKNTPSSTNESGIRSNFAPYAKKLSPYITAESMLLASFVALFSMVLLLQRRRKLRLIESVIRDLDKVA
jgi:hypothetical protein